MRSMSMVGGVVPVPKAALLLRSSTVVLLPSQCNCISCGSLRWRCRQSDGKSAGASNSGVEMGHREVEDHLGRIEGIDPARPPFVLLENPVEAPGERQHPVAHDGNGHRIDQVAVEQVELAALAFDLRQDVFLGELRVGGAAEEELLETLHVESRGRHAEDDRRWLVGGGAHGAGVADGAVHEDAVDALVAALRGADRQVAVAAVGFFS
jgi:hypothetical protein